MAVLAQEAAQPAKYGIAAYEQFQSPDDRCVCSTR
jgi:hypothetical protein